MKPTRILVGLATLVGLVLATSHVTSDANVTPPVENKPAASYTSAAEIIEYGQPNRLTLQSGVAMIVDDREGVMLYGRNIERQRPIASLTKLMTALVILESGVPLDEPIKITRDDRDRLRGTKSRLGFNGVFTRHDLLYAALGASDNRAAAALARTYPGGEEAMFQAMNAKAQQLGMTQTRYVDSSGLHNGNVSTANDLVRLVNETHKHALIHAMTTTPTFRVTDQASGRQIAFRNTNRLVHRQSWDIALSKTGYTSAAGNCLIMQTTIAERPLTIVLLNSWGKLSRYGDARRIQQWLEKAERRVPPTITASASHI
ncbi:peptidase S11 [Sulfuricaulis limicola]|uniref:Peptidase S11 n=1 Tax=Sulfuricaulis limicola TaxID=1620215 RepID=A0A1B4XDQ5_9GAMM|nr:serine hydrolase [Sulfuricaulis limicola]BAV32936.1 peptidase S11 [Sulfuricaulis limicola]